MYLMPRLDSGGVFSWNDLPQNPLDPRDVREHRFVLPDIHVSHVEYWFVPTWMTVRSPVSQNRDGAELRFG